jgi:hypothetical protein
LCVHDHHTAGQNHDPLLTDQLCEKHHRKIHELLLQAGVSLRFEQNPLKRAALALQAIAIYDVARAEAIQRLATSLTDYKEKADETTSRRKKRSK